MSYRRNGKTEVTLAGNSIGGSKMIGASSKGRGGTCLRVSIAVVVTFDIVTIGFSIASGLALASESTIQKFPNWFRWSLFV